MILGRKNIYVAMLTLMLAAKFLPSQSFFNPFSMQFTDWHKYLKGKTWTDVRNFVPQVEKTVNISSEDSLEIEISDYFEAGISKGRCQIILTDSVGISTHKISLPEEDFEQNQTRIFGIKGYLENLTDINRIEIWQDVFLEDKWNVEKIVVRRVLEGIDDLDTFYFPISRWMKTKIHYKFDIYDASLPDKDNFTLARKKELDILKNTYAYHYIKPNITIPRVTRLPVDERYSGEYVFLMGANNLRDFFLSKVYLKATASEKFNSYQDMIDLLSASFTKPTYANMDFLKDEWFARQRLQGPNSEVLRMAETIPDNFDAEKYVTSELLEGKDFQEALSDRRLFIIDYKILETLREINVYKVPAPLALFYLCDNKTLLPVAIQLMQKKANNNPVFTPLDNNGTWLLAKFWFHVADTSYQQGIAHLGLSHYLIEAIAAVTHRRLSPSHPVFKILMPHFYFTMAANVLADLQVTVPKGMADAALAVTGPGLVILAQYGLREYNMTRDGIVSNCFSERKVTEDDLPDYPYRDDLMDIYDIIREYVSKIVDIYYDNDDIVSGDEELHRWRLELSGNVQTLDGIGLKGVPGNDQTGFNSKDELIDTLSTIIVTASARHAATNYIQYEWYAFTPNQPSYLNGDFPTTKDSVSTEQLLAALPDRKMLLDLLPLVKFLATRKTKSLGNFEMPKLYDPRALRAVKLFRRQLEMLSNKIYKLNNGANPKRPVPYIYLDPAIIPNSITV